MAAPAGPAQDAPTWTVAAVARRLRVAPATLRSWSRRYGIGPADHQAGRYRRYTRSDVAELETMRRLAGDGMDLASAATVARGQHRSTPEAGTPAGGTPGPGPGTADPKTEGVGPPRAAQTVSRSEVRALVQVAQRLDGDAVAHTLDAGLARQGVAATWNQLCRPAPAALDDPSSDGPCTDAVLVLARAVTSSLHRRFPAATRHSRRVPTRDADAAGAAGLRPRRTPHRLSSTRCSPR